MAAAKKLLEIELPHERTTKGTEMFATKADGALVTNVYIKKEAFKDGTVPTKITLTVSA